VRERLKRKGTCRNGGGAPSSKLGSRPLQLSNMEKAKDKGAKERRKSHTERAGTEFTFKTKEKKRPEKKWGFRPKYREKTLHGGEPKV